VMKKRGSRRMPPGEFQPNPKTMSVLDDFLPPLLSDLRARCDETTVAPQSSKPTRVIAGGCGDPVGTRRSRNAGRKAVESGQAL
jgi:hypothetical protein